MGGFSVTARHEGRLLKGQNLTDEAWGKTKSEADVRKYWQQLPQANIGIPMGVSSGIFDVECDTIEGHANLAKDGAASLAELEAKHGALPATLMFVSPSGSVHRLYRHPGGDVRIRSGALDATYPGVDVKADGGMSIAPPSRKGKGTYCWINDLPIADAPQWLLDMVITAARAPRKLSVWQQFANSTKQADITELTLAIAMVPNGIDVSRDQWVAVGLALWSATGGSEEGYQLFRAWSGRWPGGFNEENTRTLWDRVREMPHSITAGSIFHWAEEAVPDYMGRILAHEPDVIALLEEFWKLLGEP
jgi:Bifunctional DNA primase/polymerase, N-terminal/Primase C terminal 2 (PriCT-2)